MTETKLTVTPPTKLAGEAATNASTGAEKSHAAAETHVSQQDHLEPLVGVLAAWRYAVPADGLMHGVPTHDD